MSECPRCGPVELLSVSPLLDGTPVLMCRECHRIDTLQTWTDRSTERTP